MKNTKVLLSFALASLLVSVASADDKADIKALQEEVKELQAHTQTLIDETSDLKTGFSYTKLDVKKSYSGLSPAASKVYYSKSPLSIGGYGEMYYASTEKDDGSNARKLDVYRFVPYFGYKFTDNIILNTEIEFEHGGAKDGSSGYAIIEFMYLDFLIHKNFNLRAGHMLIPMGLINEKHEPTLFTTVQRPGTEKYLLPSTWHDSGVMAYGNIVDGLEYKFGIINGLDPTDNGKKWLRSGRTGSTTDTSPTLASVLRVDYTGLNGLLVGASIYSDEQDLVIMDAHIDYNFKGARVYGVYSQADRSDVTGNKTTKGSSGYLNASFDILSLTSRHDKLPLFVQYETLDADSERADGSAGTDPTDTLTIGLNYFPHPQVVFKADYASATKDSKTDDTLSVGLGFIF